jgi:SAM-dependent MidA family methyltransferase
MQAALYDPVAGYYRRSDLERWGRAGDYRTSPERSELFAATFARYFAKLYDELQRPDDWTIVECGAGDGRFAAGALRSLAEPVFAATRYVVCDSSPDALGRARERLREFEGRVEFLSELPIVECGVVFSNELLDAFPVHRLLMTGDGLREMYVGIREDNQVDKNAGGRPISDFVWTLGALSSERLEEFYSLQLVAGQIVEVNTGVEDWLAEVAARLRNGFVVTVDYGAEAEELYDPERRPQGTLRAFSRHEFVADVLAQPGDYDITSSVDWTQVKRVGQKLGLAVVEFASQDKFLLSAGLLEVMEQRLGSLDSEAARLSLTTSAREMILPGGMAETFQVLVQRRD